MINKMIVKTSQRYELLDITDQVEEVIAKRGANKGICLVFVPHSTCGVVLTENEERLKRDWLKVLEKLVAGFDFEHNQIDNNADSHILSGLVGQGKVLPISEGSLERGTWQQIFLAEFDGPRERKVVVKVVKAG